MLDKFWMKSDCQNIGVMTIYGNVWWIYLELYWNGPLLWYMSIQAFTSFKISNGTKW